MKIKVIAFDLDDTLLDTTNTLLPIAGQPEFFQRIQKALPLLEGAEDNLRTLSAKYSLALVTQGEPKVQKQKISSLGIEKYFKKVYIADISAKESKLNLFRQILMDFQIGGSQLFSVGNRRSTDIRLAKQLGALTCLYVYGEHKMEKPETPEDNPDFTIQRHQELIKTCKL